MWEPNNSLLDIILLSDPQDAQSFVDYTRSRHSNDLILWRLFGCHLASTRRGWEFAAAGRGEGMARKETGELRMAC